MLTEAKKLAQKVVAMKYSDLNTVGPSLLQSRTLPDISRVVAFNAQNKKNFVVNGNSDIA